MKLIVATRNPGKLRELQALLESLPVELVMADSMPEVEETGESFVENAELKARAAAAWGNSWAIADDSGLEVDALNGAPGVHSNRFAGPNTSAADRNVRLLELLQSVADSQRTARYRAAVAIAAPDGRLWVTEGSCEGRILEAPRGNGGFGYDPLFYLPELGLTMAELEPDVKNRLSHRAKAVHAAFPMLQLLVTQAQKA